MTTDRFGAVWPGTYNGFSDGGPATPLRPDERYGDEAEGFDEGRGRWGAPKPWPRVSRGMVLTGVGVALTLGVVFGLVAKPDFVTDGSAGQPRAPMAPATAVAPPAGEAATPTTVPIEVARPATPPTPKSTGRLEVLPPDLARAAEAAAPVRPAPPREVAVIETPPPAPREVAPAPRRIAEAPPVTPSFNCRYAGTRSERMVCGDAELAQLDRRLDRAFDRAVASGIPYRELRAEQDDWLAIREDAARRSPDAVASIYRQRIAELNALSE